MTFPITNIPVGTCASPATDTTPQNPDSRLEGGWQFYLGGISTGNRLDFGFWANVLGEAGPEVTVNEDGSVCVRQDPLGPTLAEGAVYSAELSWFFSTPVEMSGVIIHYPSGPVYLAQIMMEAGGATDPTPEPEPEPEPSANCCGFTRRPVCSSTDFLRRPAVISTFTRRAAPSHLCEGHPCEET